MDWKKVKVYFHGAIIAAGTAFTTAVTQSISSGAVPTSTQLQTAGVAGLLAGGMYLLKVLFMGSSNSPTPPTTGSGTAATLLILAILVSTLASCAAWKSVKWSGSCNTGGCTVCANIDSVKFANMTENQLLNAVKGALSDDLISNLSSNYGIGNLGSIGWTFSYQSGNICLGATFSVSKNYGGGLAKELPTTKEDQQKAIVLGMWRSLHK
jgi:hypothetical protein